ncbi:MAG: hypothetical protein A2381_05265 [Bdellovibrionales bacterium RIFOXYB1_FULL_37_110]|nr:MAG: hypothetical protein A2417_16745 [Bdellovibrionales bacterium RIFOXYC1_FULL_37_79]OFZ58155.1 MAG: hypothetical protein A2381_05265 [Bdellovibrionales bacterium RIFOXYB1_FULL_37_110]OFZ61844.1 MAG: hypothetical protein A2577_18850 [Bdellovibrionales bacterium RIFOXYD1_FULL_36_51]
MFKTNYLLSALILVFIQGLVLASDYKIIIPEEVIKQLNISDQLKAMLASGDLVGNGGGIGEQNFRYVYQKLPTYIQKCTGSNLCPIGKKYQTLLREMIPLINNNLKNKDAIIFLSEKRYPGFFHDQNDPEERVAKTAYLKGSPIFINLDFVYRDVMKSHMPLHEMAGILVHELGHQLGELSHSMLDDLSAQFRSVITDSLIEDNTTVFDNLVEIDIYNSVDDSQRSLIELKINNRLMNIQKKVDSKLVCEKGRVFGYRITNTHWERPYDNQSGQLVVNYKGWIDYLCMDEKGLLWSYNKDITFIMNFMVLNFDSFSLYRYQELWVEIQ